MRAMGAGSLSLSKGPGKSCARGTDELLTPTGFKYGHGLSDGSGVAVMDPPGDGVPKFVEVRWWSPS